MKIIKKVFIILIVLVIMYLPTLSFAETEELIEISFSEKNMYNKICSEIGNLIEEKDNNKKLIKISENNLKEIKELNINNSEITNISGIERFVYLEKLNISCNNIKDISGISTLTNLKVLDIHDINVNDLVPINSLTNLVELNASRNTHDGKLTTFKDLTQISNLTTLEKLDFSFNYIDSLKGIENFKNLKELNVFNNVISDFSGLDLLSNLEYLSLGENNEKNKFTYDENELSKISKLTNLKYLNFAENRTPSIINYVGDLNKLEYLSLEYNVITSAEKLQNLSNLKTLILYNNSIEDITPITNLKNLEYLSIGKNKVKNVKPFFEDEVFLLPNIKKLDIINNSINVNSSLNELKALVEMDQNKKIELDYEPTTEVLNRSNLPHIAEDGTRYITFEEFGARADGVYDDFIAMRNAIHFANDNNCVIYGTPGKIYHIYKYYENPVTIKTSVDFKGANIVIHDEEIEYFSGKFLRLFNVKTINEDIIEIKDLDWTVGKNTKQILQLKEKIDALNEKGYAKYIIYVENSNKKQYIRYGADANDGATMQDYCTIDRECNVLDDIQWDFEQLTKLNIIPISKEKYYFKNIDFISNATKDKSEIPYVYNTSGKTGYYYRNIYFNYCANMEISNINHEVKTDGMSGSYTGLLSFDFCSDLDVSNCNLHAYKYMLRSTYDLYMRRMTNIRFYNVNSDDLEDTWRWGVTGSNYCKYITFEKCSLNRIDAHCGVYDIDIIDTTIGVKGLTMTGQGTLNIINSKVIGSSFVSLRGDYGATWDGQMNIINCTHEFADSGSPILFRYAIDLDPDGTPHDFGYPCKFPNVYIENLTMDYRRNTTISSAFMILRTDVKSTETNWEEWYKPEKFVINGLTYLDSETKSVKLLKTKYRFDNFDYTYQIKEGTTVEDLKKQHSNLIKVTDVEGNIILDENIIENGMRFVYNDKCEFVLEIIPTPKINIFLESSTNTYFPGEEFDITASLIGIKDIKEGINVLTGTLDYDSDILEIVPDKNDKLIECKNGWSYDYYKNKYFKFIADNNIINSDGEIFKIRFRIKDNVKEGKTQVLIKDFMASGGKGIIYANNKSLDIDITQKQEILLGDVDQDNDITINDLAQIKLHLIGKEIIKENLRVKAADLDGDNSITINDLAILKLILIGKSDNIINVSSTKEMKQLSTLKDGDIVETKGFYGEEFGGNAKYNIVEKNELEVDDKLCFKLDNGLYANLIIENDAISVKQIGAYGDGIHDDTSVIHYALNSKIKNIEFPKGEYKITKYIKLENGNINILGNDSIIFTDNDYKPDKYSEFLFYITGDNYNFENLQIEARETQNLENLYISQVYVGSSNIKFKSCNFKVPETTSNKHQYNNIDLYTGWHNVLIEDCNLYLAHDGTAGGCIWVRDFYNRGASDLIFKNNTCYKKCHDEILAIFRGTVENIEISGNKFIMPESTDPSVMCFTIGSDSSQKADNIKFEDNEIDCISKMNLFTLHNSTNVSIKNNKIKYTKPNIEFISSLIYIPQDNITNLEVSNNNIELYNKSEQAMSTIISSRAKDIKFISNTVKVNSPIKEAFSDGLTILENDITFNGSVHVIANKPKDFKNNNIVLNEHIDSYFQYYNGNLSWESNIKNNTFEYNYDEISSNTHSTILLLNGASLNENIINFEENTINGNNLNSKNNYLYLITLADETPQTIRYISNNTTGYTKKSMYNNKVTHNVIFE